MFAQISISITQYTTCSWAARGAQSNEGVFVTPTLMEDSISPNNAITTAWCESHTGQQRRESPLDSKTSMEEVALATRGELAVLNDRSTDPCMPVSCH